MRNFLLLFVFASLSLNGQTTREFEVSFDKDCWLRSSATSEKFALEVPAEADFTGLSAYVMNPEVEVEISYRIKTGREWGEWRSFRQNSHGETPDRTAFEADPIQTSFSQIQFRCSDTVDTPFIFRLYFPGQEKKSPDLTESTSSADTCGCPQPAYCDRSCWCPDGSCNKSYTPVPTQPTHIIVHHSAGFSTSNNFNWVVSYYWDLHVNTNGWDDIGYHWLIDANGVIYEARGSGVTGAHFSCMNANTTGICMIGNFENSQPTAAAKTALKELISWEACASGIVVQDSSVHSSSQLLLQHVSGHLDGNVAQTGCPKATLCPGNFLYSQLPQIVGDVAAMACMQTVNLQERNFDADISIYPNPVGDRLQIQTSENLHSIKILDVQGQILLEIEGNPKTISTSQLPVGVYFLQLMGEKTISQKRFIKN